MPTPALPSDDLVPFDRMYAAIELEAQRGNWSEVSEQLKGWAAGVRGTLTAAADRRRLAALGLALLTEGSAADCRGLVTAFRPAGEAAIVALQGLLVDRASEFEARWFAGQILAKLHQVEAMTGLVAALDSEDEMTASIAIDALGHFGKAEIDLLVGELDRRDLDPDRTKIRRSLVRALTQISDPVVVAPLLSVARDPDPTIRRLAIGALSAFDDDRVVPVLIAALRDTSAPIRKTALSGLGAKAQYQREYRSADLSPSNTAPSNTAPSKAPSETSPLEPIDWLAHFQPLTLDLNLEVATQATIAIGRLSSSRAIAVLLDLLRSPLTPPPQALAIVRALLPAADRDARPESIAALLDTCTLDPERAAVTLETVRGLGRLRAIAPTAAALLADWCDTRLADAAIADLDPTLLQAIAYSFGSLRSPIARPWLARLAADPRDRVRISAASALNKLSIDRDSPRDLP